MIDMGVRLRLPSLGYLISAMVSSWIDIHFSLSHQAIGIISYLCRDITDSASFSFIFYIPDLVKKSLPKLISYLVQDR